MAYLGNTLNTGGAPQKQTASQTGIETGFASAVDRCRAWPETSQVAALLGKGRSVPVDALKAKFSQPSAG
jgi:hypothetical protein